MRTLADLGPGESARLTQLDFPDSLTDIADILMEAGFVPGDKTQFFERLAP
jgi:hypothetical protein